MNQRRWNLSLGGIKSRLEIVCFQVAAERVKCIGSVDRVRKGIGGDSEYISRTH